LLLQRQNLAVRCLGQMLDLPRLQKEQWSKPSLPVLILACASSFFFPGAMHIWFNAVKLPL
jgi:hypothetical protein